MVRLETSQLEAFSARGTDPVLLREAKQRAGQWLSRFLPLLDDPRTLDAPECRSRLETAAELREEGRDVLDSLTRAGLGDDAPTSLFREALAELDHAEEEIRKRLGAITPGDHEGIADLEMVRRRLAEAAARREVRETAGWQWSESGLELTSSHANPAAAAGLGIFSLGWLGFTTFHAVMMIGGMARVFGLLSLFLLAFYAIFFMAGFAMAYGAFRAAAEEKLALRGRTLTLTRRLCGRSWERRYRLGPNSRARLVNQRFGSSSSEGSQQPLQEIEIRDEDGRGIRFGTLESRDEYEELVRQINSYLAGQ
jgi:hypothetical protein